MTASKWVDHWTSGTVCECATVWEEARLRWGHNDQSRWGHQCSKTTLTEESRFHISTVPPLGLNPGPSWREANGWTSGPVELCVNAVRLQALHKIVNCWAFLNYHSVSRPESPLQIRITPRISKKFEIISTVDLPIWTRRSCLEKKTGMKMLVTVFLSVQYLISLLSDKFGNW